MIIKINNKNLKLKTDERGITLIEVLVTIVIFSVIITAVGGIFIRVLQLQRQGFLAQQVHENVSFILEEMAREIRVSQICPEIGQCTVPSILDITHPVNGKIQYSLVGGQIHRKVLEVTSNCSSPACDTIINSSSVSVNLLNFFISGDANNDGRQPRVTIVLKAAATQGTLSTEISAQTTVSQRYLSDQYKSAGGVASSWFSPFWEFRKKITIDGTKVAGSSSLSNFPVLLSITDADLKNKAQSNGNDILFTLSDGVTKLNHEIEKYTNSSGTLIAWINVPTVNVGENSMFYMYYGNAGASNQQNVTGVWGANYNGVWHMNDNAGNKTVADSAGVYNATNVAHTNAKSVTGEIGNALTYNGSNDSTSRSNFDLSGTSVITMSFWLNWNNFANDDRFAMSWAFPSVGNFWINPNSSGGGGAPSGFFKGGVVGNVGMSAGYLVRPSAGAWHYYSFVLDKGLSSGEVYNGMYLDGSLQTTVTTVLDANNTNNFTKDSLYFMSAQGTSLFGAGSLDEFRISNSARSSGWIQTEYNNQSLPNNFYSVGAEEI